MISTLVLIGFILGYGVANLPAAFDGGTQAAVVAAPGPAPTPTPAPPPKPAIDADTVAALPDDDPSRGDADAPVTIVEFSDYQCPFCGRFFSDTLPQIVEKYIDAGKARFVYRDYPLSFHLQANLAANAANCAGDQEKYWEMHDKLFEGIAQWADNDGAADVFKGYAADLGLQAGEFASCLDDAAYDEEISKDIADGTRLGVNGTPSFFINDQFVSGAQPYQVFESIIEVELAE